MYTVKYRKEGKTFKMNKFRVIGGGTVRDLPCLSQTNDGHQSEIL